MGYKKYNHYRIKKNITQRRKYRNSEHGKEVRDIYNQSEQGKNVIDDYNQSERKKEIQRKNHKKYYEIDFSESPWLNTEFRERIVYNLENGSVKYYARFCGRSPYKIIFIDI